MEIDTKEKLLQVAKELFAEKGFDGVSVKEICDVAHVNISAVSYHFDGKDGLYRQVLERFGEKRLAAAQVILQPVRTIEEMRVRLEMFAMEFLRSSVEESAIACIVHREMSMDVQRVKDVIKSSFVPTFEHLENFFAQAQADGLLAKHADTGIAASLFWGSMIHLVMSDRFRRELSKPTITDEKFRKKVGEQLSQLFLHGLAEESPKPKGRK